MKIDKARGSDVTRVLIGWVCSNKQCGAENLVGLEAYELDRLPLVEKCHKCGQEISITTPTNAKERG